MKVDMTNADILQEVYPINMANALRKSSDGAGGIGVGAEGEPMFTLTTSSEKRAVAVISNVPLAVYENQRSEVKLSDKSNALSQPGGKPGQGNPCIFSAARVRKLMPIECERLQGFPDDYTKIPYRGKPAENCPDSPRYKAIGNSWAVPCVRWIGERIKKELEK